MRRTAADRQLVDPSTGWHMGRYRCANLACGWQGLLPRRPMRARRHLQPVPSPGLRQRLAALDLPWARAGSVLLVMLVLVLVAVQGARHMLGAQPAPVSLALPAGQSPDGDPLPARHPWAHPVALAGADAAPASAPAASGRVATSARSAWP